MNILRYLRILQEDMNYEIHEDFIEAYKKNIDLYVNEVEGLHNKIHSIKVAIFELATIYNITRMSKLILNEICTEVPTSDDPAKCIFYREMVM